MILLLFAFHHAARASLFTGLILWAVISIIGFPDEAVWVSASVGAVITVRFLKDWRREYKELWLDRDRSVGG
jgi:hypothetical protein